MSQAGILDVTGSNPQIPTMFDTDSGTAIPVLNTLNIFGGTGISTSGAGNTVTISLSGGGAVGSFNVDASTPPGTDPVLPDGSGLVTITGGQVSSGTVGANVIRTDSLAANTFTIEVQQSGSAAALNTSLNGVAHFNSAQFTVSSGFVSLADSGVGIDIIQGDSGQITGNTVRIFANTATLNCGQTVNFTNSGTDSTFNVSDSNGNTIIGNGAGRLASTQGFNTILGVSAGAALTTGNGGNTLIGWHAGTAITTGDNNEGFGQGALLRVTSGVQNLGIGNTTLSNLLTGGYNIAIGQSSGDLYVGAESSNILINHHGVATETNTIRIGTQGVGLGQQARCFVAGITGVTVASPAFVVVDSTGIAAQNGQLGVTAAVVAAWTDITGATQTLAVGNGYVTDRGGGVTYTLPATATFGDEIKIVGKSGITSIAQNANQAIRVSSSISTTGAGGSVVGTNVGDCITLRCTTGGASTIWIAETLVGNWIVT